MFINGTLARLARVLHRAICRIGFAALTSFLLIVPLGFCAQPAAAATNPDRDPRLQQAVTWATQQMAGAKLWIDGSVSLCDQFVENAFGVTAQYPTAYDMYLAVGKSTDPAHQTIGGLQGAPAGAIVFFDRSIANGGNGHVGIYLGNGQFIGVVSSGKVKQLGVQWWNDTVSKYLGWTYPRAEWPGSAKSNVGKSTTVTHAVAASPPTPLPQSLDYATRTFHSQWQTGETVARNLWGPALAAPKLEEYRENSDGYRLVQYFDKGRMELADPKTGTVTNGLLATEMITGQVQVGDDAFTSRSPATIPIAGDPDNPGPTYAALGGRAAKLLAPASSDIGKGIVATVSAAGDITETAPSEGGDPRSAAKAETTLTAYDTATKHNVPAAFAAYRAKVGTLVIGYAKSEPFIATVKVGGVTRQVVVQVFERRVLTYNAANADPYKVEMGNIGQHYQRWRYGSSS